MKLCPKERLRAQGMPRSKNPKESRLETVNCQMMEDVAEKGEVMPSIRTTVVLPYIQLN